MRCKNCDYRLWNLRSRQCPECNTPFRPSDYEFVPNSIQFACPHCDKRYYGTDEKGHLVPIEFACLGCGRQVHMDEMILLPTTGLEEEQTAPWPMPWLERAGRGFVRSWLSTIGSALVRPGRLIRSTPVESSLLEAWWFAILTHLPVFVLGLGLLVFSVMVGVAFGGGPVGLSRISLGLGIALLLGLILTAAGIGLWGGITHGVLCLVSRPTGGLRRTYQCLCYSAGANLPGAVPFVGFYVGLIWWLVSAVVMVKDGQRVSGGRANLAVLTLPVLVGLAVVGFYVWVFVSVLPQIAASPAQMKAKTQFIAYGVSSYSELHDGQSLGHVAQLVFDPRFPPQVLLGPGSNTTVQDIPVGPTTLDRFMTLRPADKLDILKQLTEAMPEGTVAQRLGDFVFTYHGMDLTDPDPRLWVVVLWPDPDLNPPPSGPMICVGLADGTTIQIPVNTLPARLAQQNVARQENGLPPLPDPRQVTYDKPGVVDGIENGESGMEKERPPSDERSSRMGGGDT